MKPNCGIIWDVTDDGKVHQSFFDGNDKELFAVAFDIDFWFELADDIDDEIESAFDESSETCH